MSNSVITNDSTLNKYILLLLLLLLHRGDS